MRAVAAWLGFGDKLGARFTKDTLSGRLLGLVLQLCDALAHAHDRGIVHRDMKPDNIVISKGDVVKVLDFGLARVRLPEISHLTRSGSALGTCSYMSPEQASGRPADERSDQHRRHRCCRWWEIASPGRGRVFPGSG